MTNEYANSVPASSNVRGAAYPRVHPDRRVTFRVEAPTAQAVQVQPGGDRNGLGTGIYDMQKGTDGAWYVTVPPAVPGFHYYWLLVDGVAVNDPSSETYFGYGKQTSGVEIPDPDGAYYAIEDVPHGEVRSHWYFSKATGAWRRANIYTPPGYDQSGDRRYPVLYLQHGAGEDERGWTTQGRANFILDNLIAAGLAEPMLVVMDCGYALVTPTDLPFGPELMKLISDSFGALLLGDLIPTIDAAYRTSPEREQRALAGLSMGGRQALEIGLTHLEIFAWIGVFSGAMREAVDPRTSFGGVFQDVEAFNQQVRLFWLGAGSEEPTFVEDMQRMHAALEPSGVKHEIFLSEGTSHEWQTWRRSLRDFAPRLFKTEG
jgi:enterochelin esterase-like enzyme